MPPKDRAAVALGRRGGQASMKGRTKAERIALGQKGAKARWKKVRAQQALDKRLALE